jgi:uncharacterized membrane protein YqjE
MAAVPEASHPGLVPSLARLARSLLSHLRMRLQLLGLEIEQEKERILFAALAMLLACLFFGITLMLAALAVIVHFWDTPDRLAAVVWMTLGAAALSVALGIFALQSFKRPSTLFQASLAELLDDEAGFSSSPVDLSSESKHAEA